MDVDQRAKKFASHFPFYYGWVAVAFAFLAFFFSGPGQTYTWSLFIDHFIQDFGWSRSLVNTLYSVASLTSGLSMFLVGRLVDKKGAKFVTIAAGLILAATSFWLSALTTLPMLFMGYLFGRFSGQGTLMLASSTIAPHWFLKKRGLAIMLATMGTTVANMVFPKVYQFLIEAYGWRSAFQIMGVVILVVFIPLCARFIINKPEDIGLYPDGVKEGNGSSEDVEAAILDETTSLSQPEAMKTFSFWVLFVSAAQLTMILTGIGLNFVSISNESGITDMSLITTMMSLAPVIGIVTSLIMGIFSHKIKRPHFVIALLAVVQAISYIILGLGNSQTSVIIYTILIGLTTAIFWLMLSIAKPFFFGRKYIGAVSGVLAVGASAGSAFGPILFGLAFDTFGGYTEILVALSALPIITAILLIFMRQPAKRRGEIVN